MNRAFVFICVIFLFIFSSGCGPSVSKEFPVVDSKLKDEVFGTKEWTDFIKRHDSLQNFYSENEELGSYNVLFEQNLAFFESMHGDATFLIKKINDIIPGVKNKDIATFLAETVFFIQEYNIFIINHVIGFDDFKPETLRDLLKKSGAAKKALNETYRKFSGSDIPKGVNREKTISSISQNIGNTDSKETKPNPESDLEVLEMDWATNQLGQRFIKGKIKNVSNKNFQFAEIKINLYDQSGDLVGNTLDNVMNLSAGQVWSFEALVFQESATRGRVSELSSF